MQWKGAPPVLAKLSGESVPLARTRYASRSRFCASQKTSDREQLAGPIENPNHHAENESKTEDDHKAFLALHLHVWLRPRNGFARGRTLCVLPLAPFLGQ